MDSSATRRDVLKALVQRDGLAVTARVFNKPERQINDMISDPPRKSFGEKVVASMERHVNENRFGWLSEAATLSRLPRLSATKASYEFSVVQDTPAQYQVTPIAQDKAVTLVRAMETLALALDAINDHQERASIGDLLKALAISPDSSKAKDAVLQAIERPRAANRAAS